LGDSRRGEVKLGEQLCQLFRWRCERRRDHAANQRELLDDRVEIETLAQARGEVALDQLAPLAGELAELVPGVRQRVEVARKEVDELRAAETASRRRLLRHRSPSAKDLFVLLAKDFGQ